MPSNWHQQQTPNISQCAPSTQHPAADQLVQVNRPVEYTMLSCTPYPLCSAFNTLPTKMKFHTAARSIHTLTTTLHTYTQLNKKQTKPTELSSRKVNKTYGTHSRYNLSKHPYCAYIYLLTLLSPMLPQLQGACQKNPMLAHSKAVRHT